MASLKNKQNRIIVVLCALALVLLVSAYFLQSPTRSVHKNKSGRASAITQDEAAEVSEHVAQEPVRLPKKVSVENELKIEVEPTYVSEEEVRFSVALASYQNSESVGMDPLETTILLDEEDTPYAPLQWEVDQEDEYNKTGVLTFRVAHFPKSLKLSIFELEERVFEWSLTKSEDE
jgi:hypothetical protein